MVEREEQRHGHHQAQPRPRHEPPHAGVEVAAQVRQRPPVEDGGHPGAVDEEPGQDEEQRQREPQLVQDGRDGSVVVGAGVQPDVQDEDGEGREPAQGVEAGQPPRPARRRLGAQRGHRTGRSRHAPPKT
nr:hypothetical protein [Conexibacter sp. W3-3-2]